MEIGRAHFVAPKVSNRIARIVGKEIQIGPNISETDGFALWHGLVERQIFSKRIAHTPWEGQVMDTQRLAGKNIMITGAAQGMGAANAEYFAAQGANLCIGDVNLDGVQEVAERINSRIQIREGGS